MAKIISLPQERLEAELILNESLAGHYEASFNTSRLGRYRVEVSAAQVDAEPLMAESEIYWGYDTTFQTQEAVANWQALTSLTGGKVLLGDESLAPKARWTWRWLSAWPLLQSCGFGAFAV
ncbi:MAG: hypothetical protein R2865_08845 [Deinococcales bacterium]